MTLPLRPLLLQSALVVLWLVFTGVDAACSCDRWRLRESLDRRAEFGVARLMAWDDEWLARSQTSSRRLLRVQSLALNRGGATRFGRVERSQSRANTTEELNHKLGEVGLQGEGRAMDKVEGDNGWDGR